MIVGINAARARSGGAIAHLVGILTGLTPSMYGIRDVHVWSYPGLLALLPEAPWLKRHSPPELEHSLVRQVWWERFCLADQVTKAGCSILLNVDAGSVCRFRPSVTMSRDMLSYEPGEIKRFGIGRARLRLILLRFVQNASLKASDGVVFLTRHAGRMIQESCGSLPNVAYIPHGVSAEFQGITRRPEWPESNGRPVRCLYVSNCAPYKHQWHVVEAVAQLRIRGYDLELELVGGGEGKAQGRLDAQIAKSDPDRAFVVQREFVPRESLLSCLCDADLFLFASSCENMPNTLLEAMAAGLPVACSNRGPMPEVLDDGGVYFNPEDPQSIGEAIKQLLDDPGKRADVAARGKKLSEQYSWPRCARETFSFIAETYRGARSQSASIE